MVASSDTVTKVLEIMRRHVDKATLRQIAGELLDVPGNKSFRETVQRLYLETLRNEQR